MAALCKAVRVCKGIPLTGACNKSSHCFPRYFAQFGHYSAHSTSSSFPADTTSQSNNAGKEQDAASTDSTHRVISVDRSGLYNHPEHGHKPRADSPMVKHLKSLIKFRGGPISVAEYMEEVLTNPVAGFYMNRDVFGGHGDFVTSPEVSQMFGEMGQPKNVSLVELGPGRGTLMVDLLRSTAKFKEFSESISVHLVECSPALRKIQYDTLQCISHETESNNKSDALSSFSKTEVSWYTDLQQVPRGGVSSYVGFEIFKGIESFVPSIVIAHEFYDALPIHQFQKTPHGWCEKLIDVAHDSFEDFCLVLSREPTAATKLYLSKRLKSLEKQELAALNHVEVCPKAAEITESIARRIGMDGGAALIIDYGRNSIITDSLQAIRKHKFVNILDEPGTADLSAYVDFEYIRQVVEEINVGATTVGPISQSQFLGSLGINFRLEALLENADDEQAEALQLGYWRLVGDGPAPFWEGDDELAPIGMGSRYMALAIINDKFGRPVCFQ